MKSHYFAWVAVSEDSRLGGPGAKYIWCDELFVFTLFLLCIARVLHLKMLATYSFLFRCKTDEEANAVAFAISESRCIKYNKNLFSFYFSGREHRASSFQQTSPPSARLERTLTNSSHRPPEDGILKSLEQLETAVKWWNNNTPPLLHYSVNKACHACVCRT